MTELQLHKFIEESLSETSFDGANAIMWVAHYNVSDFADLIGSNLLSDGGIEVRLQEHGIAIDMNEVCEHHAIEIENIFPKG